jgi:hypothetical protein
MTFPKVVPKLHKTKREVAMAVAVRSRQRDPAAAIDADQAVGNAENDVPA